MPKAPTTFDELTNDCHLDEREALVASSVLPNLPSGEALIAIRGYGHDRPGGPWYNTDDDERLAFERRHRPIVPGGTLYRTKVPDAEHYTKYYVGVEPVPHPFRTFKFEVSDLLTITPVDPDDYDFSDVPVHRLSDFGCGSPFFNPYEANRDAFDRNPALPV